jgi:hypothetical protein
LNSRFHIYTLLLGIAAIILALLGCCTSKTRDKTSVCCFSFIGFIFLVVFVSLA